MWDYLINLDQQITLFINGSHNLWLDGFALSVTATATWIPALLVLLYVIIHHGEMKEIVLTILAIGLCVLVADQIASGIFKPWICRPRPTQEGSLTLMVDVVNNYRGGMYGFFSSHAANTFAVTTFVALLIRRKLLTHTMIAWALLNCWSRIYLGVHYFGDVTVGILCGILVGFLVHYGFRRLFPVEMENGMPQGLPVKTSSGYLIADAQFLSLTLLILFSWCAFKGLMFF